jgi:hypothetical protein
MPRLLPRAQRWPIRCAVSVEAAEVGPQRGVPTRLLYRPFQLSPRAIWLG